MRATSLVKQILGLNGVVVRKVSLSKGEAVVNLKLTRTKLLCPKCKYSTKSCYDTKTVDSRWRHLDIGAHQTSLSCSLRRLKCPRHGVITQIGAICQASIRVPLYPRLRTPGGLVYFQYRQDHSYQAHPDFMEDSRHDL